MKLYTINATPIRKFKQLSDSEKKYIRKGEDTLKEINARALELYPGAVALTLTKHGIDGFTIYPVQGYWKGESEMSYKIEVALDDDLPLKTMEGRVSAEAIMAKVSAELRDIFNQEAVMLTNPNGEVEFI